MPGYLAAAASAPRYSSSDWDTVPVMIPILNGACPIETLVRASRSVSTAMEKTTFLDIRFTSPKQFLGALSMRLQ